MVIHDGETFTTKWTAMEDSRDWSDAACGEIGVSPFRGESIVKLIQEFQNYPQREKDMDISSDYTGKIKRIGKQYLLQLGCAEFICQDLKAVGVKVTAILTAEYKKRDTPEDE